MFIFSMTCTRARDFLFFRLCATRHVFSCLFSFGSFVLSQSFIMTYVWYHTHMRLKFPRNMSLEIHVRCCSFRRWNTINNTYTNYNININTNINTTGNTITNTTINTIILLILFLILILLHYKSKYERSCDSDSVSESLFLCALETRKSTHRVQGCSWRTPLQQQIASADVLLSLRGVQTIVMWFPCARAVFCLY